MLHSDCFFSFQHGQNEGYTQRWAGKGVPGQNLGTGPDGGVGFQHFSLAEGTGENEGGGGKEAGGSWEVIQVIPNSAAGTNGSRSWTISGSKGGASAEDN